MGWADKYRTMKVRTNADTPADAKKARELGAEGIGLCRTEHMFFEGNRIDAFREMICSETEEEREAALEKILPEQQGDFEKLYEALEGNPVTIRFLEFRQRKRTSRNWLTLRARPLSRSKRSSMDFTSSTR